MTSWLPMSRLVWGGLLVGAPGSVLRILADGAPPAGPRVVRILGARHVLQAAAELVRPTSGALRAGAPST